VKVPSGVRGVITKEEDVKYYVSVVAVNCKVAPLPPQMS
jgi:hypothetical protein